MLRKQPQTDAKEPATNRCQETATNRCSERGAEERPPHAGHEGKGWSSPVTVLDDNLQEEGGRVKLENLWGGGAQINSVGWQTHEGW